jgi:hypothetical protein
MALAGARRAATRDRYSLQQKGGCIRTGHALFETRNVPTTNVDHHVPSLMHQRPDDDDSVIVALRREVR